MNTNVAYALAALAGRMTQAIELNKESDGFAQIDSETLTEAEDKLDESRGLAQADTSEFQEGSCVIL